MADNKRAIGRIDGVFDAIVGAIRTHSDVVGVKVKACGVLRTLVCIDGTALTRKYSTVPR